MAWARWGATKWVQNEPRAVADNSYDDGVPLPPSFMNEVSFETFWKIIRPAVTEQATPAHMDAIFKRGAFLVNSKEHLYYRPAGINKDPVRRISMPICEYLTEEGKQVYGRFKGGEKDMPECFEEEIQKEQEWIEMIMKKILKRRKATKQDKEQEERLVAIRQGLFGDRPAAEPSATDRMEVGERERVKVRGSVRRRRQRMSGKCQRQVSEELTWQPERGRRRPCRQRNRESEDGGKWGRPLGDKKKTKTCPQCLQSLEIFIFCFFGSFLFFVYLDLCGLFWHIWAYCRLLWPFDDVKTLQEENTGKTLQGKQCKTHGRTVHSVLFCLKSGRTGGFCSSFQNDGRRRRSARDISIRHVRMSEVHFVSLFGQGIYKGSCEIQHLQLQVCCPVDIQHLSFSNGHVTKTWTDRY